MEFIAESDYLDDDDFIELPCEFCDNLFIKPFLTQHETNCVFNPDNPVEPKEEIGVEEEITKEATISEKSPLQKHENLSEKNTTIKNENVKQVFPDFEELPDDVLQGNHTTYTFGSTSNEEQKKEEGQSYFKPIFSLNSSETRYRKILNVLSDSDNEDGESLEEFWKKADVKLSARLKKLEKNKLDRKV